MAKRIFDIVPPKRKSFLGGKKEFASNTVGQTEDRENKKRSSFSFGKKFILIIVIILAVSGFVYSSSSSSATIVIWPETRVLNIEEKIIIDKSLESPNLAENILTGEMLDIEKEISQQFDATGSILKKAKGTIRIYNNYSTAPQTLIATTRFFSSSGKLFRIPKKVVVPGGHYEKGKLVAGYIDVEAIADQAGEEYNIEPDAFSIPGFAGDSKYTLFYARSFSNMTGGGKITTVTQGDLDRAQDFLSEKVNEEGKKILKEKAEQEGFVLLDEIIEQEITEAGSLIKVGAEKEKFSFKVKGTSKGLVFPKDDLDKFVERAFSSQSSKGEVIHHPSLKIDYSLQSGDFNNDKITLNLKASCKTYKDIDIISFKAAVIDKPLQEVEMLLDSDPEINKFIITSQPFWQTKVPGDLDKINIEVNID